TTALVVSTSTKLAEHGGTSVAAGWMPWECELAPALPTSRYLDGGGGAITGSGTLFLMAGIDWRYANIAFRSASVMLRYACHGIGGRTCRPRPCSRPFRIVSTNCCSVHEPRPVSL